MGLFRFITHSFFRRDAAVDDLRVDISPKKKRDARSRLLQKIQPKTAVDCLTAELSSGDAPRSALGLLAVQLRRLPKVTPRVVFRERLRAYLVRLGRPHWTFRFFEQVAAVAVVMLLVAGVFATSFFSRATPTLAEAGRLTVHDGAVFIRAAHESFYTPATSGQLVYAGATLRMLERGHATLDLVDQSQIEFTNKTEIAIADVQTRDKKSTVRLAVISGEVASRPHATESALTIETPSGRVAATAAMTVSVDEHGSATLSSDEDFVVESSAGEETVVPAGQTALLAAGGVDFPLAAVAEVTVATSEKDAHAIATRIDIAQIRMFDALRQAQAGEISFARELESQIIAELDQLLALFDVTDQSEGRAETLSLLLGQIARDHDLRVMHDNLRVIATIQSLLRHYSLTPEQKRGEPSFSILTESRYAPPTELHRVFAAMRTHNLARASAAPLAARITENTAALYADATPREIARLMIDMAAQPIYLPFLRALLPHLADEEAQLLVMTKITALEEVLASYAGLLREAESSPAGAAAAE